MGIVYGGPGLIPQAPVSWAGLAMKWIGWDGSEWTLSDESTGTVLMPGVRGVNMPPIIHHRAAHASMPGARWRGSTVDIREGFWPIQIYSGDGSQAWIDRDRAFWKTIDPNRTGTWIVIQPDGRERKLKMRFKDDTDYAMRHDPALGGWANYGITFEAEQPYWEGEEVFGLWETGTPSPFFGAVGSPAFTISPGGALTEAKLLNPGDVETYIVWELFGPITSAEVGINGRNIVVPFSIAAGQVLQISTSPQTQLALQGPVGGPLTVDKTGDLGAIDFAALPPGEESDLSLSMVGTGAITAAFTPLYYRAW